MGTVGWQEMVMIFVLALVLFGPKEMARIGRTLGKAIADFRRASGDLKATFDRELNNLERESQSTNEAAGSISDPSNGGYRYNYGYDSYYDAASKPPIDASIPGESSTVNAPAEQRPEPAKLVAPEGTEPANGDGPAPHSAPVEPGGDPQSA